MAPPRAVDMERFDAAVKSMTSISVPKETAKRVLEKLLILYENNWEHIEADSYRTLTDAIFDEPDPTQEEKKKRSQKKNLEGDHHHKKLKMKEHGQSSKSNFRNNGKSKPTEVPHQQEGAALNREVIRTQLSKPSTQSVLKEPKTKAYLGEPTTHGHERALVISGEQHVANHKFKGVSASNEGNMVDAPNSQSIVLRNHYPTNSELALSNSGKGKLSFLFDSSLANGSHFHMPDVESVCKAMKDKCLRSYKILDSNFSFMKLLDDTCKCIIDLGSGSSVERERGNGHVVPAVNPLSRPSVPKLLRSNQASSSCMPLTGIGSSLVNGVGQSNSSASQNQLPTRTNRKCHDVHDIAKGEERVRIPIVIRPDNEDLPPPFHYIPQSIISQNAYVDLSLARIGDENCCSECFGDCLAAPLPCACASETGGEFAYERNGLLKKEFLDACISMGLEPDKHNYFCKVVCPLEKIKIDRHPKAKVNPDPCKGHLLRKFIKECWRKCGCARNCGNRVVQRGITGRLEVFPTPEGKGWGLRTAETLGPGSFVCEYAGEILTNTELYERNNQKTGNARHTYPLMLNADWGTERVLEDDHALCLDGTFYGNVARFINHRCFDGNLIGIPVEIETPDHHYYHLAFFTKRQVEPYEELTWDYEIDFDDVDHPIKAFRCRCGSPYCRDKRRVVRSK